MDESPELRWSALCSGDPREPALLAEVDRRYGEAHRAYHGRAHLDALAKLFVEVERGPGWRQAPEVKLAILLHDVIYEPGRPDNEARSAALARERLASWPVDVERVASMIEATAAHDRAEVSDDPDLAHFLDADMSILGALAPIYDGYTAGVRREFAKIPAASFRQGRRRFVEAWLRREALFHSAFFRARFEDQARANLRRELAAL